MWPLRKRPSRWLTGNLIAACASGASDYQGTAIAAHSDPSDASRVICWKDGHVFKSPPIVPGFDRFVFVVRSDGTFLRFVRAGYRTSVPVQPPG